MWPSVARSSFTNHAGDDLPLISLGFSHSLFYEVIVTLFKRLSFLYPPPFFLTVLCVSIWSRLARGRQGSEALLYWSCIDQQGQRCPCESTRLIEDVKPLSCQTDIIVKYSPLFPEDVWCDDLSLRFFLFTLCFPLYPHHPFFTFTSVSHS